MANGGVVDGKRSRSDEVRVGWGRAWVVDVVRKGARSGGRSNGLVLGKHCGGGGRNVGSGICEGKDAGEDGEGAGGEDHFGG